LHIGTALSADTLLLRSFAGCSDKILGVEYEDCSFQAEFISPALGQWLNETVDGTNPFRDAEVLQLDRVGKVIGRLPIGHAFLRAFSGPTANSDAPGTIRVLTFVMVPTTLGTPVNLGPGTNGTYLGVGSFEVSLSGVNSGAALTAPTNVASLRGIHMTAPKLVSAPIGSRHQFLPGKPTLDNIQLQVVSDGTVGTTISDLQTWVDNVTAGQADVRNGAIRFLDPAKTVIATVQFPNLSPVEFLPFPISTDPITGLARRLIEFTGSFRFP
jgi:hypothetical protein